MTTDPVRTALYFDDLRTGQSFETTGRTVTETDLVQFAMLSGDWNPLHVDKTAAEATEFGRPVVHGVCGLAILGGLVYAAGWFATTAEALLGFDELRFLRPLFPGDTVRCRMTIENVRVTSKGKGLVQRGLVLVNQRGEAVLSTTSPILIERRSRA